MQGFLKLWFFKFRDIFIMSLNMGEFFNSGFSDHRHEGK